MKNTKNVPIGPPLEFEEPIIKLEERLDEAKKELEKDGDNAKTRKKINDIEERLIKTLESIYSNLRPWQKTQVARYPLRPHTHNYIKAMIEEFVPLAGDRNFSEDEAIIGGLGWFRNQAVMVIGQEKGHSTTSRILHNFGMPRPEGFRKAIRLMQLAERFNIPVITFVDTPGADPGISAEERGQAEAIARSTDCCLALNVPIVTVIIGEGRSGGAVALSATDKILMLEHAVYSVASPEACASILWRSSQKTQEADHAMKTTAQDMKKLGIIDRIIAEPPGGAHRNPERTIHTTKNILWKELSYLLTLDAKTLRANRREKFLALGRNLTP